MKIQSIILALILVFGNNTSSFASEADAKSEKEAFKFKNLQAKDIRQGTRQYLVYVQDESGKVSSLALWNRTTKLIEQHGKTLIEIRQKWYGDTPKFRSRELYSLNKLEDFTPLYHSSIRISDEGTKTRAFTFDETTVVGDKKVKNNEMAEFSITKSAETLNWELDMETFSLLPLGRDKVFHINFYHPGSKTAPSLYTYKVIGDEVLATANGMKIDTWKLYIDYNGTVSDTFWLDKKTGELVKLEQSNGQTKRYKVRLDVATGITN